MSVGIVAVVVVSRPCRHASDSAMCMRPCGCVYNATTVNMYVCMYVCMYVHTRAHICVCIMGICMYVYVYVYVYVYIYI